MDWDFPPTPPVKDWTTKLTGQELYHYERAGYFVRRGGISAPHLNSIVEGVFLPECKDDNDEFTLAWIRLCLLLGATFPGSFHSVMPRTRLELPFWRRLSGMEIAPERSAALYGGLHLTRNVTLVAAAQADSQMVVMPGSHAEPLGPETLAQLRAHPDWALEGQVRLRLEEGDLAFLHPNLVVRQEPREQGVHSLILHMNVDEEREGGD